jgi:competence protein ComEC
MRISLKSLFVALSLALALTLGAVFSLPDDKLHLVFCDVGQGDAILVTKGTTQILIDGGPSEKVLGCLSNHLPFWDKDLEMVILTHPEYDHITGLVPVIERYSVKQLSSNSLLAESGVFNKFRDKVIERKIPVFSPKAGEKIKIGNLEMEILFPL